ncbi:hypothetical protein ESCO_001364 [Escovopsis weberi]|uniref:3,2-trans-enoyl-CoA isomerase n=1 Tax=Escovopsis weberi TaxID=150374 RepID=A0A0M9VTN7_ESCWE|nr:hypothetical protein ESCO_001364 [Escovopsis weberi]
MAEVITVEYLGRVAVLTIRNEKKLGALTQQQYYELAQKMREVATHKEVYVTVLLGTGRYFSAGADVNAQRQGQGGSQPNHQHWLQTFVAFNLNLTQAFATHPKILVVGLNGPVVGLSAALAAHADFVYAVPSAFLLTPFASLGLVAEGASSRALVARLGAPLAKEALLMSRKIGAAALARAGFVNRVFDGVAQGDDAAFRARVLAEVDERLGAHLDGDSMLGIKRLIGAAEDEKMALSNYREVFEGLDRFMSGEPQERFRKIAGGEMRHKL